MNTINIKDQVNRETTRVFSIAVQPSLIAAARKKAGRRGQRSRLSTVIRALLLQWVEGEIILEDFNDEGDVNGNSNGSRATA